MVLLIIGEINIIWFWFVESVKGVRIRFGVWLRLMSKCGG